MKRLERVIFRLIDVALFPALLLVAVVALALDEWEERIEQKERRF